MSIQHNQLGFSVVELVVVIVAIVALSSLAFINVINTQRTGRDTERQEDVGALVRHFETLYDDSTFGSATVASYPGQIQVECGSAEVWDGVSSEIFLSPTGYTIDNSYCSSPPETSVQGAQNNVETPSGVLPQPSADTDIYVYQALDRDNNTCAFTGDAPSNACIRFNMYYYHEGDGEVKKVSSRRQ